MPFNRWQVIYLHQISPYIGVSKGYFSIISVFSSFTLCHRGLKTISLYPLTYNQLQRHKKPPSDRFSSNSLNKQSLKKGVCESARLSALVNVPLEATFVSPPPPPCSFAQSLSSLTGTYLIARSLCLFFFLPCQSIEAFAPLFTPLIHLSVD